MGLKPQFREFFRAVDGPDPVPSLSGILALQIVAESFNKKKKEKKKEKLQNVRTSKESYRSSSSQHVHNIQWLF